MISRGIDMLDESLPIAVLACRALEDLLLPLLPQDLAERIVFTDYGMHSDTRKLNDTVQGALEQIKEPSLVILGYGLCGDGLNGIRAGKHTLLIPRTDDCIPLLMGSYEVFVREFKAVAGTYYLSKGWLESGDHPLGEYEEYVAKYGPDRATLIMDMQYKHCERLMLVAHSQADLDKYRHTAQEIARYCEQWDMRYEEMLGSDAYIRRLVGIAVKSEEAGEDFLMIPPNGKIRREMFLR